MNLHLHRNTYHGPRRRWIQLAVLAALVSWGTWNPFLGVAAALATWIVRDSMRG